MSAKLWLVLHPGLVVRLQMNSESCCIIKICIVRCNLKGMSYLACKECMSYLARKECRPRTPGQKWPVSILWDGLDGHWWSWPPSKTKRRHIHRLPSSSEIERKERKTGPSLRLRAGSGRPCGWQLRKSRLQLLIKTVRRCGAHQLLVVALSTFD